MKTDGQKLVGQKLMALVSKHQGLWNRKKENRAEG